MPECLKCKKKFPRSIVVDGKKLDLRYRKYCFECSPLKKDAMDISDENATKSICSVCGRSYIYSKKAGHTLHRCNTCCANIRKVTIKQDAVVYKGGKCIICGYDKCIKALEFHHLIPSKKQFNISGSHSRSWESIKLELDKCILVCSNCHAEIEDGMHKDLLKSIIE